MDPKMFSTIAELGCTYILMHMRGTPETMNTMTSYPDGVVDGVATELYERVQQAMKAGVRRWRIILDPGIGFAKTGPQNLELMRKLPELRGREGLKGLLWCVGVSRKRFIGKVTRVPGDAGREEEVEEVKKESGPNYLDTDIEKKKWDPTLTREDEPQHIDTEIQSSKGRRTRREKKKKKEVAEEGKGNGPSYYRLDIDFNSNATTSSTTGPSYIGIDPNLGLKSHPNGNTTTFSNTGPSYISTDPDPGLNSQSDANNTTPNQFPPSYSPGNLEIGQSAEPLAKQNNLQPTSTSTLKDASMAPSGPVNQNHSPSTDQNTHPSSTPSPSPSPSSKHSTPSSSTQDPLQSNTQNNLPSSDPSPSNAPFHPLSAPQSPPPSQNPPQPDSEMQQRIWGTAAAVTACIQGGADIVRVHDWEEMSKVVRMADAVWRV